MVGAGLEHTVTMTVFPLDARRYPQGDPKSRFPGERRNHRFADSDMMIEIQAAAAAPDV